MISCDKFPQVEITFGGKHSKKMPELIDAELFIGVKSFRAKGKRLTTSEVSMVRFTEPLMKEVSEPVENENLQEMIENPLPSEERSGEITDSPTLF